MTSFSTPPDLVAAQSLGGNDTGTVASGSSVTVSAGTAVTVALATAPPSPNTGVQITNSGTIKDTIADGRAINASGTSTGVRILRVTNGSGAVITSTDDAVRVNSDLVAGSTVAVVNDGTISSTATGSSGGQGIDFNAITTAGSAVTITNRATGSITAADNDAVRPGQNGDVENSGQITSGAAATPSSQPSADGIDFQDNHTGTVHNFGGGAISGARHGIAGGTNTTVNVTNDARATITGRNGSGVGLDGSGSVVNSGTITGTIDTTSARGDGDGVDIDLTAAVTNYGTIQGLGAKGNDSGGRTNAGEGLSLGGGTVANYGSILSSAMNPDGITANTGGAIVVNNDANANRSGNASTTITNFFGASITGGNNDAIRLENKGSAALDTDQITNYGTITGNGTIPDPNGTVTYVAPAGQPNAGQTVADPNSVGTLDGVTYTGTGSARFVRGDGSAIQMGEGADTLTDYGTIVGNTGRAVNLEGGDDTLNLHTGSTISGRLDGGAGTDTLNLRLDDRTGADITRGANSGSTSGTLSDVIDFEVLNVQGGIWSVIDAQAYSGGATIASGATLQVGNDAATGSLAADIADGGSLVFDRADASRYSGVLTGTGSLSKRGAGTLALTGSSAGFSGAVTLRAGVLELAQLDSAGTGGIAFTTGAQTLRLDVNGTYANAISGFSTDGDVIDLASLNPAGATARYNGTTLTVTNGADTATLTLAPAPSGSHYSVQGDGGTGTDVVLVAAQADPPAASTTPSAGSDSLTGSSGNDTIAGLSGNDTLNGLGGDDLLLGNQGDDLVTAGDGMNTVAGGMGRDRIAVGNGSNLIYGGEGADTIAAGNGADTIVGGTGNATLDADDGADSITVGSGNDLILGNQGNDTIALGGGADTALGGMGDDLITSSGIGNDLLLGGEGSDTIMAGNGADTIVGGTGNGSSDSLDGADEITSGSGNDLILGNGGNDSVGAGAGNDTVAGGFGDDVVLGNQGNDVILGNQGRDTLFGGQGADTLVGGQGNDVLYGNEGDDVLYGNEGLNTFVFNPGDTGFRSALGTGDTVMDFATGTSRIDFASGPAGSATNFGATATTATDFAAIQALGQTLIDGGDAYAFVADGTDGFLFTTGGTGTAMTDAVKLVGAGTASSLKYQDIAHGALA